MKMIDIKFKVYNLIKKTMTNRGLNLKEIVFTALELKQKFDDSDNFTWLRFTGLKDKNGVEIYEGDIIFTEGMKNKDENGYRVVDFKNGSFRPKTLKITRQTLVIGNIYENPELLSKLTI